MRTHPDDPEVHEISVDEARARRLFNQDGRVCVGCPHINTECPRSESPKACRTGKVWYGHHIHMANKLEGE